MLESRKVDGFCWSFCRSLKYSRFQQPGLDPPQQQVFRKQRIRKRWLKLSGQRSMPWERRDENDPSGFEIKFNFSVCGVLVIFGFVDPNESQNLNMISENVTECQERWKWMSMTQLGVTVPRKLWKNSLKISICSNNIMSNSPCQHTAWVGSLNWSRSLQLIQLS